MNAIVKARGLAKSYGDTRALKPATFEVPAGRVVGLIGANGAGKTTMLNAILGLLSYEGELSVLGKEPYVARAALMHDISYIADVATLPRWMKVAQLLDFIEGVHPNFDRALAENRLASTKIRPDKRIKTLSKGMNAQLHLAIVMAIDAKLLVLDEPTLGLDILFRKKFYETLISEFFDEERTIIISTHQVEEIEQILTHVMFLKEGDLVVDTSLEALQDDVLSIEVVPEQADAAEALGPIARRNLMGQRHYIYEGVPRDQLAPLGKPRRVPLSDIFVAKMEGSMS